MTARDVNSGFAYKQNKAQRLQEILFSLNIGFAVVYALFAFDGSSRVPVHASKGPREFLESFQLMLGRIAPLGVHNRTKSEWVRSGIIREAAFGALALGATLLIFLLVRLIARSIARRSIFAVISGLTALVALPGCWLYIVYVTWGLDDPLPFWDTYGSISVLEIAIAAGFLYLVRDQAIWCGILVFSLHYIFWVLVIGGRDYGAFIAPVTMSIPLSVVFPISGFVWLRYVRALPSLETP